MDCHYSQHYYSGIIPILPIKAIGIRLSSIYKVISLVIYEVRLESRPYWNQMQCCFHHQGLSPRPAFQVIPGQTTTSTGLPLDILCPATEPLTLDTPHIRPSFCCSNTLKLCLCIYWSSACTSPSPDTHWLASFSKLTSSGRPSLTTDLNKRFPVPTLVIFYHITYFLHSIHHFFKVPSVFICFWVYCLSPLQESKL